MPSKRQEVIDLQVIEMTKNQLLIGVGLQSDHICNTSSSQLLLRNVGSPNCTVQTLGLLPVCTITGSKHNRSLAVK